MPIDPASTRPAERETLASPDALDIVFSGFTAESFEILQRLKNHPHIERYRLEKEGIARAIKEPFRTYRDDLVVNLVLPNRLALETERNVFSRLLKNDFGAGGCHYHKWMSFYRPVRTRLTDIQLAHSLHPEAFRVSVYAGRQARDAYDHACCALKERSSDVRAIVNAILRDPAYRCVWYGAAGGDRIFSTRLAGFPEMRGLSGFALMTELPASEVIERGRGLVEWAIGACRTLWPFYRLLIS